MRLFAIILCMFFGVTSQSTVESQDNNPFRKLDGTKLQRTVDNNTFWKVWNLDRVYFAPDGTFTQQLNNPQSKVELGTIYTGSWSIDDASLCWKYDDKTALKHKIPTYNFCYNVYSNAPDDTYMTTHMEEFILYRVVDGQENANASFEWNRWNIDSYILSPELVPDVLIALDDMRKYRSAGGITDGTTSRDELNENMKKYYDLAIGKIFFVHDWQVYFGKNGNYFVITEGNIKEKNRDTALLTTSDRFGKWSMKDNIHCFTTPSVGGSCEFIALKGEGLIRDYEGMLGFHASGFSRIHGETEVGHIDPADSSFPELFKAVDEIFAGK